MTNKGALPHMTALIEEMETHRPVAVRVESADGISRPRRFIRSRAVDERPQTYGCGRHSWVSPMGAATWVPTAFTLGLAIVLGLVLFGKK